MNTNHPLVGINVIVHAADSSIIATGKIVGCYKDIYHFIEVGDSSQVFSFCVPESVVNSIVWRTAKNQSVDIVDKNRILGTRIFHFYKPKAL